MQIIMLLGEFKCFFAVDRILTNENELNLIFLKTKKVPVEKGTMNNKFKLTCWDSQSL